VTSIGTGAFLNCFGLTNVTIGNGVTNIGSFSDSNRPNGAFGGCSGLTSVTIPNSVTSIGTADFAGCSGLTSVTIGNSVTTIGNGAFFGCSRLTSVMIPNSVTTIGDGAFFGCYGLTSVTIPKSVTDIGIRTFRGCMSLREAYFQGNQPIATGDPFEYSPTTIYYLPGATGWGSTFGTFGDRPAFLWNPEASVHAPDFGIKDGKFGFTITGTDGIMVVVEACDNLSSPVWVPMGTNTLTAGFSAFSDATWNTHRMRVYRFRSP
jgi:BspA type Leucine rich repeat region (6 copies)